VSPRATVWWRTPGDAAALAGFVGVASCGASAMADEVPGSAGASEIGESEDSFAGGCVS